MHVDTEGTFRPERIVQIAERFGIDAETANDNITYIRAQNSEHQHEVLCQLSEQLVTGDYRLLVVDSICALFRVDYIGRAELSERQQKLGLFLQKLTKMAEEFNLTVFMTNQVQSDPGASALFAGADGRKPIGGHVVAHASTTRILLRKGRGEERVAKVQDSPGKPAHLFPPASFADLSRRLSGARGNLHHHHWWHRRPGKGMSASHERGLQRAHLQRLSIDPLLIRLDMYSPLACSRSI